VTESRLNVVRTRIYEEQKIAISKKSKVSKKKKKGRNGQCPPKK
jgi:hypothetical protein